MLRFLTAWPLALAVLASTVSPATLWAAEPDASPLEALLAGVQAGEMQDLARTAAHRAQIEAAGVELGVWSRIGPFRDQPPLLNWMENTASSFACVYEAQSDLTANGGRPLFDKTYTAANFPTTPDAVRRWTPQPEWIDGYLCDLPRGPAPSAGETQYVYRTITAAKPVTLELEFAVRSPESDRRENYLNMEHWRRQTLYECRLNGEQVCVHDGKNAIPVATKLELKAGVNHFLAKVTNNRHSYGFSFAIAGLHPAPRRQGPHERPWRPFESYRLGDLPYHREAELDVKSVSGENWWEALFAWAQQTRRSMPDADEIDLVVADFEGPDYGDWKTTGEAFGPGPAAGTIGGQMKVSGFDGKGLVNSFFRGDAVTGTLTSPPIMLERAYVNFLVGGGAHQGKTCMNLLVDGKIVRTVTGPNAAPGGSEALDWRSWDVAEFRGKQAVFQIVDQHSGGWGHINVDQITLSNDAERIVSNEPEIWAGLMQRFPDPKSRMEIELTRGADSIFWNAYAKSGDRGETERALANYYISRLAALAGRSPKEVLGTLGISRNEDRYVATARQAYFAAAAYREGLARLKAFRYRRTPMPGIEAAVRDPQGRVITPMEAALDRYGESASGERHRKRVEAIGAEIESLLNSLANSGDVQLDRVADLNDRIEAMWTDEIRNLPPIIFLQRPAYHYDALQFTKNGAAPAAIRVFDPAERKTYTLFDSPSMRAHDMTLSWDAQTVFIGGGGNVAEVGVDGEGYRVITSGQSPAELPDGRIVFFDDTEGISPCKSSGVRRLLYSVDRDGGSRKVISANLTIDTTPQVMSDGRVIFCRWDYGVNKNVFNRHGVWVQNPDGTALDLYFGNTIIDPFAFYRPRQVPGRPEVLCVFGTHHNHNAGLVGLIWQGAGREGGDGEGFRRVTQDTASVGDACPLWAYQDPYPLNEQLFLVSYGGAADANMAIYLLDRFGNKKCVYEPAGELGAFCPQPMAPRERPQTIPSRTNNPDWAPVDLREQLLNDPDWSQKAVLTLQDVYRGIEPEVERGRAKHLAVMEQVVHTTPRGGSIGVGTIFYVNRLIGLVPIKEDGSACFEVPALRSLYFHILDADGKMLMTMGSDMHAMPGERRSCIGCHEGRKNISTPEAGPTPLALGGKPVRPRIPDWGTNGILEYEAVVQPVFDKYCIECHAGGKPDGQLDLTNSRTTVYNMSYMELVDKALVHYVPGTGRTHAQPSADYDEQSPLSRGSLLSKITPYLEDSDHCGEAIPWEDRFRIYSWIDANVPFYSHYSQMSPTILSEQARGRLGEVYQRRCATCHDQRPRKDAIAWLSRYNTWVHSGERPGQWGVTESGMRVRHLNLTKPAHSQALQAPLAADAGGLGLCGGEVFHDKDDPDYTKMLEALTEGVIVRDQPGVHELLRERMFQRSAASR